MVALLKYLREHLTEVVPIGCHPQGKHPLYPYKGGSWTWERWNDTRLQGTDVLGILIPMNSMVVIDFDSDEAAGDFFKRFDGVASRTAVASTRRGYHVYFGPSEYSQGMTTTTNGRVKVDVKAGTHSGTPSVCIVPPSPNKQWMEGHEPWTKGLLPMPRDVAEWLHETVYERRNVEDSSYNAWEQVAFEDVERLVMGLGPQTYGGGNYDTWLSVVFAVCNLARRSGCQERGRQLLHAFSRQDVHAYDEKVLAAKIRDIERNPRSMGYGFPQLKRLLKASNPEMYDTYFGTANQLAVVASAAPGTAAQRELNRIVQVDEETKWEFQRVAPTAIQATPKCTMCLVQAGQVHADHRHSTLYVSEERAVITCVVHQSRALTKQQARCLQQLFGIVQPPQRTPKPFEVLRDIILGTGVRERLRKRDGAIYKQTAPCTYQLMETYPEFINRVLRGHPAYTSDPRMHDMVVKFLDKYNEDGLPELIIDRNLLAFDNGVLLLSTAEFVTEPADDPRTRGKVARHHISAALDPLHTQTPLMDALVCFQMSKEAYSFLRVMLGRLFFAVGQRDRWQVMPFLYGDSNTGKSTLLNVIKAMFSVEGIAIMSSNTEGTFGLESKHDRELLMFCDTPKEMSRVLNQQTWQSMVSGEAVEIPRKHQTALQRVNWKVPMVWASNYIPDYKDSAGAVARRIMVFKYRTYVPSDLRDTTLLPKNCQR